MIKYIECEAAIAETRKPRLTDAELRRRLACIPAADVQPVRRGKWIIVDQGDTACLVECDQCGMHYIVANDVFDEWLASENRNYCPKCGADMRRASDG